MIVFPFSFIKTSGLVLYFDPSNTSSYPGTGTTITDLSGNGRNGTMSNISFTSPYFTYNGISSQVEIADNVALEPGSGDWTMEVWVNQSVSGNDVVLGKFDPGGQSVNVSYSIRTTGTTYYAQIGSGSGSGATLFINSTNYIGTINTWYHLVYVFTNTTAKTLETFVNGASIGSVNHSLASILNTTANLYIGSYNNGEYAQWFDGKIGITRIYNRALTATEVSNNYITTKIIYESNFSQAFVGGTAPLAAVETAWNTFRASLTGTYTSFTWSSTNGSSLTVTDPTKVQTLANNLRTATAGSVMIGSTLWLVGVGCGTPKIGGVAVEFSNNASCSTNSTYALRPMINNANWGGTNQSTVNAPSQTITLTFF
jgi:hypothetical protein